MCLFTRMRVNEGKGKKGESEGPGYASESEIPAFPSVDKETSIVGGAGYFDPLLRNRKPDPAPQGELNPTALRSQAPEFYQRDLVVNKMQSRINFVSTFFRLLF